MNCFLFRWMDDAETIRAGDAVRRWGAEWRRAPIQAIGMTVGRFRQMRGDGWEAARPIKGRDVAVSDSFSMPDGPGGGS